MAKKVAKAKHRLTVAGVALSVILFALKTVAGLMTGSIAIVSDALNSLLDIAAYTAVFLSVRIQEKQPDDDHHFGHRRAEPLAGFLIATFAGVLGANLIKDAILSLLGPAEPVTAVPIATWILLFSIVSKIVLAELYRRQSKGGASAALHAGHVDSRNDVLASGVALIGFWLGRPADELAALVIGSWILYTGVKIGLENLGYLMGEAPGDAVMESIMGEALRVDGVLGFNDLRAHYVGDRVHVEIHIEVADTLSVRAAHDIGVKVRRRIQALPDVQIAFVHVDPVPSAGPDPTSNH